MAWQAGGHGITGIARQPLEATGRSLAIRQGEWTWRTAARGCPTSLADRTSRLASSSKNANAGSAVHPPWRKPPCLPILSWNTWAAPARSGRSSSVATAANRAAAFRLEFDHEVTRPLCLGHASHFGLGLFLPAE